MTILNSSSQNKFCPHCGFETKNSEEKCSNCGTTLGGQDDDQTLIAGSEEIKKSKDISLPDKVNDFENDEFEATLTREQRDVESETTQSSVENDKRTEIDNLPFVLPDQRTSVDPGEQTTHPDPQIEEATFIAHNTEKGDDHDGEEDTLIFPIDSSEPEPTATRPRISSEEIESSDIESADTEVSENFTCPHCGNPHPATAKFCPFTAKPLVEEINNCPNCQRELPENARFCPYCNYEVRERSIPPAVMPFEEGFVSDTQEGKKKQRASRSIWIVALIIILLLAVFGVRQIFLGGFLPASPDPTERSIATPTMEGEGGIIAATSTPANSPSPVPTTALPSKTPTTTMTRTRTPTRTPTQTPTIIASPSPQPIINQQTNKPRQCSWSTRLAPGMYAFAMAELKIYDKPRFQTAPPDADPEVLGILQPGDRVFILVDNHSPNCYHRSYFWKIQTAPENGSGAAIKGWVYEYYLYDPEDTLFPRPANAYFLGPYPP